jgi:gamma-glutamyltranspeptidase/glutathione hydrolase
VAEAVEGAVTTGGDGIDREDLAAYAVEAEAPVTGTHAGARLAVTPPPSQAALALLALEALRDAPPPGTAAGEHAAIEAIKQAFERREHLRTAGGADRVRATPLGAAPDRASDLRGPTAADHTAAVTTADGDGLVVSMLVSVFHEFGSGVLVPEGGFVLNNRLCGLVGADPLPPGGSRALHTLSPMLLEHDVHGVLALATPGADGQVQILVQLARLLLDAGVPVDEALDVPRWRAVRGSVLCEAALDDGLADGLAALGHAVERRPDGHPLFGAAAVAGLDARTGTVLCGTDPRREVWGAVR